MARGGVAGFVADLELVGSGGREPVEARREDVAGHAALLMIVGGAILFVSALLLITVLFRPHGNSQAEASREVEYAEPLHPVQRVPHLMNSFGFWVGLIVVYMIASYGYPILQFFLLDTHGTVPWSI